MTDLQGDGARRGRDRELRRRALRRQRGLVLLVAVAAIGVVISLTVFRSGPAGRSTAAAAPRRHLSPKRRVGSTVRRGRSRASVPILMYHVIAPPVASAPYPGLYVPAPEFAAQMRALKVAGYQAVTLDEVRAAWRGTGTLPSRPIVVCRRPHDQEVHSVHRWNHVVDRHKLNLGDRP